MVDQKLAKKAESMSRAAANETLIEQQEKPVAARIEKKAVKKPALPAGAKMIRKVG